jgi:hypothetical protein
MIVKLTQDQLYAIDMALSVAKEVYKADSENFSKIGHARLAAQFDSQISVCEKLQNYLANLGE